MSVDIQKQIRDNANDASAFFKDLYEWTEDMNLAEKRRGGGGTAKSFVPPPRGKVEEEPKKKTAVKEQSGTAKKEGRREGRPCDQERREQNQGLLLSVGQVRR
jgi:hypothetical protein